MRTTNKIKRTFQIASMLLERPMRATQISSKIGASTRTVNRDLRMLVSLGFDLNEDFKCRYYIATENKPEFIKKFL